VTFDFSNNNFMDVHHKNAEPWKVTLVDTGENTLTGGRLKRIAKYVDDEDFCFTYGDGVSDIDISRLINFHKAHGKKATITAVQAPGRFGALDIAGNSVKSFVEKQGFFLFRSIFMKK
jgi:glucose-1-phosphate cytidylyltransferase